MSSIPRGLAGHSFLKGIAWSLVVLDALLIGVVLVALLPQTRFLNPALELVDVPLAAGSIILAGVGAVAIQRQPSNWLAWTLLTVGAGIAVSSFAEQYAAYGLVVDPGSLPGARSVSWISFWVSLPMWFFQFTFLLLLYPDGHLPSRSWRPVAWAAAIAIAAATLWAAFGRVTDETLRWTNPAAQPALAPLHDVAEISLGISWLVVAGASVASLALRFRRSRGVQRQQLKWFFYAVALFLATFLTFGVLRLLGSPLAGVVTAVAPFASLGIPVAIGIAVLRHQLFDIDLLINRTLVYGALTATLGAGYVASILVLQAVLSPLTQDNALAVAASTLTAAALFQPARRRIQVVVDRRFYRSRYDAARIVGAFTGQLRQDVDLDRLTEDLRLVAERTMQPTLAVVWLREERA